MSAQQSADSAAVVEHRLNVDSLPYRRLFPWLRMFDLFWIAIDLQKLALATVAVLLLALGNWGFQYLPFAPEQGSSTRPKTDFGNSFAGEYRSQSANTVIGSGESGTTVIDAGLAMSRHIVSPLEAVLRPAQVLFRIKATWSQLAMAWTHLLWALMVFGIFGAAITRIAAVQIGGGEKLGIARALKFSLARFLAYFGGPLLPFLGVGLIWALCFVGGLVGRIPDVGPWVVGLFWGLALLFGLLMALMLIGAAIGWPLMLATISVEGSDSLDGLSRSYGYVFAKPWYFAWLIGIAVLFGILVTTGITLTMELSRHLAIWAVAWGMGSTEVVSNPLAIFWSRMVFVLISGFVMSYFWSAVTMIYFLLRRCIDANDFSEVYLEEEPSEEMLPAEAEGV